VINKILERTVYTVSQYYIHSGILMLTVYPNPKPGA